MTLRQRIRLVLPLAALLPLGLLIAIDTPQAGSQTLTKAQPGKADVGPANGGLPAEWAQGLRWRELGPCNMSGRIVALSVYEADPSIWWAATSSAGLLKTTNNGITLKHQFDKEGVSTVGDVAVAPSNPNIVYVGTGENNPRNSVSYGDGVYKSTDGGETWQHVGLRKSYQIGKIAVHPKNPDVVYVGALGRLWGDNEERGLYKTTDGGKTWTKVLHIDDKTGIIDLVMHPSDPDTLIVASWERRRDGFDSWPGSEPRPDGLDGYDPIKKWGAGSAIWKTTDGGKTWKRLAQGLPTCKLGRIGLDVCRKDPNIVYAVIDCENIGKGPPPLTAYLGAVCQDGKERTTLSQVMPKSPAAEAGLQVGDVIEAVGGKPVATFDALLDQIRPRKVGDTIALQYNRGGASKTVNITLERRPTAGGRGAAGGPGGRGAVGGRAAFTTVYLGIIGEDHPGGAGARLTSITEGGPAEKAGLEVGDIIVAADGKKVADYDGLLEILREGKPGQKVALTLLRGKEKKTIAAILGERPPFGGGAGGSRTRPYLAQLAGQNQDIQDMQGSKGYDYGGVYKSTDGGETWTRVNSLNPRPMYFSQIRVDPSDPNRVYLLGVSQYASTNGGVTFQATLGRGVHADGHALWIDPRDGRHMLIGCDGGVYQTYDRGANWDHFNHVAIGQFYHVALSPRRPYYAYGGLQDNGSWGGPAETRGGGAINEDWLSVGGGDGFTCRVDQTDPDWVYWTSQGGNMGRRNMKTGERASIRPGAGTPGKGAAKGGKGKGEAGKGGKGGKGGAASRYRFNWSTPFILSHQNQRIFYCGSQYVHKSLNRGDDLRVISPELTLTKRGSMTALSESPRNPDVLWAGTDDGALWVTRDGGRNWTQVTKNLGLDKPIWVSTIEASRFEPGRCYVCLDAHRQDDDRPYLFKTEDYGRTWEPITANLPEFGSTRCLREDLVNPDLLFCGTEFHLFASIDRGKSWTKLNTKRRPEPTRGGPFGQFGQFAQQQPRDLPTVAIHEVAIHPTAGEIVVATHGRSLWAADVSALRQVRPEQVRGEKAVLYKPLAAERFTPEPARGRTNRRFVADNPPAGASIWYGLPRKADKVSLKVMDVDGKLVRELPRVSNEPGLHRVIWNLDQAAAGAAGAGGGGVRPKGKGGAGGRQGLGGAGAVGGRPVPPGTYRIVLSADGQEQSQTIQVIGTAAAPQFRIPGEGEDD